MAYSCDSGVVLFQLCYILLILHQLRFHSCALPCLWVVVFFKFKARSKGIIYNINDQSVFYLPLQLIASQMISFVNLSVTVLTDRYSLITDKDMFD